MSAWIYGCGQPRAEGPEGRMVSGGGGRGQPRRRHYTVDMHCHVLTPAAEQLVADRPERQAANEASAHGVTPDTFEVNQAMLQAAHPKLTDLATRFADMDAMGVDLQVISPGPNQYYYWADVELARGLVRTINEHIAELVARHPDRLLGMGSVALQHPELCIEQLEHCVRILGLRGVEISSLVGGLEIANPKFERFWARCAELGCVVFLHPLGTTLGERVRPWYLSNQLGQPLEHTIAISHLIFGGVLDRHPGLKLFAGHGGGYLAACIGRADHAWRQRSDCHSCARPPSEYLKQLWYDTVVYRPQALRHLAAEVGVDRLIVGTDYPYDMGDYGVHELIDGVTEFTDAERAAILGGNAMRLLGLSAPPGREP